MVSEDAAEEPLMRGDNQDADDGEHRLDEPSTAMPRRESELHSPGVWMWMLAFSAGISGLLFGCKCSFLFYFIFYFSIPLSLC
jgi:hypothetical protein